MTSPEVVSRENVQCSWQVSSEKAKIAKCVAVVTPTNLLLCYSDFKESKVLLNSTPLPNNLIVNF